MTGTYRTTLVYTKDGHYGYGCNARNGASEMKKIDRRSKRRQSDKIKREALRELEYDTALDLAEALKQENEAEYYDEVMYNHDIGLGQEYDDDFNDDYWRGDYGNQPDDDVGLSWYDEDAYYDCADSYYSRRYVDDVDPVKTPKQIEAEEAGMSLGDILSYAIRNRSMPE